MKVHQTHRRRKRDNTIADESRWNLHSRRSERKRAARNGVIDHLKLVIENYRRVSENSCTRHPEYKPEMGGREVPFSGEDLWIDRADFREEANKAVQARLVMGKRSASA